MKPNRLCAIAVLSTSGLVLTAISTPAGAAAPEVVGVTETSVESATAAAPSALAPATLAEGDTPTLQPLVARYTGPTDTAAGRAALPVITCTPVIQRPHNSTHVPGTVNTVVTMGCTGGYVDKIQIRAALYRNSLLVKDSGAKNFYNTRTAQNNAAEPCHAADYVGWGSWAITFPGGYTPRNLGGSNFGTHVQLGC